MSSQSTAISRGNRYLILCGFMVAALLAVFPFLPRSKNLKPEATSAHRQSEPEGGIKSEVELSGEAQRAAGIEFVEVSRRPFTATLRFTGTIEANPMQTQQVTPLIGGRVERVNVAQGDRVRAGAVIAIISSPGGRGDARQTPRSRDPL